MGLFNWFKTKQDLTRYKDLSVYYCTITEKYEIWRDMDGTVAIFDTYKEAMKELDNIRNNIKG